MIKDSKEIKNKHLREFYDSNGKITKGLNPSHLKNLRRVLHHLHTAKSLSDIYDGFGRVKNNHKLTGHEHRYAMSVSGNYRIVYDCKNPDDGVVTIIEYIDYH